MSTTYVPLGERDPARQRALYRELMGRDAGPPVPLGLTYTRGRFVVTLNVASGELPKRLRMGELLRDTPRRRRRPTIEAAMRGVTRRPFAVGVARAAA